MFRFIVSALCIIVGLQLSIATLTDIAHIGLRIPFRDYPVVTLQQLLSGMLLWLLVAARIAISLWLLYASIGESIWTARRYKRR